MLGFPGKHMDSYSRVSALGAAVDVLKHRVEIILPVLPGNDEHQEKQNKIREVTWSSHFLIVLLHKQKKFLEVWFKPLTGWKQETLL